MADANFNPRTRVGCDDAGAGRRLAQMISIHAPGWGATFLTTDFKAEAQNFNPRTRVGCDDFCDILIFGDVNFNPRTRVGCDEKVVNLFRDRKISIHAPGWGATR